MRCIAFAGGHGMRGKGGTWLSRLGPKNDQRANRVRRGINKQRPGPFRPLLPAREPLAAHLHRSKQDLAPSFLDRAGNEHLGKARFDRGSWIAKQRPQMTDDAVKRLVT